MGLASERRLLSAAIGALEGVDVDAGVDGDFACAEASLVAARAAEAFKRVRRVSMVEVYRNTWKSPCSRAGLHARGGTGEGNVRVEL